MRRICILYILYATHVIIVLPSHQKINSYGLRTIRIYFQLFDDCKCCYPTLIWLYFIFKEHPLLYNGTTSNQGSQTFRKRSLATLTSISSRAIEHARSSLSKAILVGLHRGRVSGQVVLTPPEHILYGVMRISCTLWTNMHENKHSSMEPPKTCETDENGRDWEQAQAAYIPRATQRLSATNPRSPVTYKVKDFGHASSQHPPLAKLLLPWKTNLYYITIYIYVHVHVRPFSLQPVAPFKLVYRGISIYAFYTLSRLWATEGRSRAWKDRDPSSFLYLFNHTHKNVI